LSDGLVDRHIQNDITTASFGRGLPPRSASIQNRGLRLGHRGVWPKADPVVRFLGVLSGRGRGRWQGVVCIMGARWRQLGERTTGGL